MIYNRISSFASSLAQYYALLVADIIIDSSADSKAMSIKREHSDAQTARASEVYTRNGTRDSVTKANGGGTAYSAFD
jgi:hypothetical protein